jgi:hypothetical protein
LVAVIPAERSRRVIRPLTWGSLASQGKILAITTAPSGRRALKRQARKGSS